MLALVVPLPLVPLRELLRPPEELPPPIEPLEPPILLLPPPKPLILEPPDPKALVLPKLPLPIPNELPFICPSELPRPSEFLPVEGESVLGPLPPPSSPLSVSSISEAGAYLSG